MMTWR